MVIHYGGDRKQTTVRNNGGKNPRWGESFSFMRTGDTVVRLEVWDKDTFTQDDLVGSGQVNIMNILNMPMGPSSQSVELYCNGRAAGRVNISVIVQGGMGMGGMGMGMGVPMGGMVNTLLMSVSAALRPARIPTRLWPTLRTTRLRTARIRSAWVWSAPLRRRRMGRPGLVIIACQLNDVA